MLLVRHLLVDRPAPHLLTSDLTVRDAARFLRARMIGGAPVVDDERLVGFCSERDLVFNVLAHGRDPDSTRVRDVMTREVVTACPDDTILDCEEKIRAAHCRHLPVVECDRVIGCLSMREFLQSDLREREEQLHALTEYIRSAGA
jgi:CBS domain-containing protein